MEKVLVADHDTILIEVWKCVGKKVSFGSLHFSIGF